MAKQMSSEEVSKKRADAALRTRIKKLFSEIPEVRADAQEALKEAWGYEDPCFNLSELAAMDPQAATLSAMRRDTSKIFINWLTKL